MEYSEIVKTETFVKKTVQTAINIEGPGGVYLSVDSYGKSNPYLIDLVIGANHSHRCASALNKRTLKSLIDILVDIHDAMVKSEY